MTTSSSRISRAPAYSRVEMTQIVLPGDANALGTAFGGRVMQWVDIAAAVAARRHSGGVAVTASIDSLQFVHPVRIGDVIVLQSLVNRAWRTSMEVGVRVECEEEGDHERAFHAATAYLTFVAVDHQGKPREVPQIAPESDEDRRRYDEAARRREMRLGERA
ncbi:MAG: acyl-CoA thioesterase [Myxococcales bacterium]|nr:acyl-CoA thioesterase [Myxococcales bacterium]